MDARPEFARARRRACAPLLSEPECVVQDIAILRASGTEIFATPQGYRLPGQSSGAFRAILACRHARSRREESPNPSRSWRQDPRCVGGTSALRRTARTSNDRVARRLTRFSTESSEHEHRAPSSLTHGVHLHTVEASRKEMISRAKAKLRARGILLK